MVVSFLYKTLILASTAGIFSEPCQAYLDSTYSGQDSIAFTIRALDLSENVSVVSSGQDELMAVVFVRDSGNLVFNFISPINTLNENYDSFTFLLNSASFRNKDSIYFMLIELDDDSLSSTSLHRITTDPDSLLMAHRANEWKTLEWFLNDNDLLYCERFSEKTLPGIDTADGVHLFDTYTYLIIRNLRPAP